jgi:hypothetical protein
LSPITPEKVQIQSACLPLASAAPRLARIPEKEDDFHSPSQNSAFTVYFAHNHSHGINRFRFTAYHPLLKQCENSKEKG